MPGVREGAPTEGAEVGEGPVGQRPEENRGRLRLEQRLRKAKRKGNGRWRRRQRKWTEDKAEKGRESTADTKTTLGLAPPCCPPQVTPCGLWHFKTLQPAPVTYLATPRGLWPQAQSHDPSDLLPAHSGFITPGAQLTCEPPPGVKASHPGYHACPHRQL